MVLFLRGEAVPTLQGGGVFLVDPILSLTNQGIDGFEARAKFVVIPSAGGHGGKESDVGGIVATHAIQRHVVTGAGDADESIESYATAEEAVAQTRTSNPAIAFSRHKQGRPPSLVLAKKLTDEGREGGDVLADAEVLAGQLWASEAAVAGTGRIDDHHIGEIEPTLHVVHGLVRWLGQAAVVVHRCTLRTERSHVEPKRGATGATIEGEGDRTLSHILAILGVGHVEHAAFHLAVIVSKRNLRGGRGVVQRTTGQVNGVFGDGRR